MKTWCFTQLRTWFTGKRQIVSGEEARSCLHAEEVAGQQHEACYASANTTNPILHCNKELQSSLQFSAAFRALSHWLSISALHSPLYLSFYLSRFFSLSLSLSVSVSLSLIYKIIADLRVICAWITIMHDLGQQHDFSIVLTIIARISYKFKWMMDGKGQEYQAWVWIIGYFLRMDGGIDVNLTVNSIETLRTPRHKILRRIGTWVRRFVCVRMDGRILMHVHTRMYDTL